MEASKKLKKYFLLTENKANKFNSWFELCYMDSVNRKIIEILEENSRESYTTIAEEVGVSEATIRNRVKQLKETGAIEKFTIELGSSYGYSAYILARVSTTVEFDNLVDRFPEDLEVHEVTGKFDLLIKVSRSDKKELNSVIDDVRRDREVEDTRTHSILSTKFT